MMLCAADKAPAKPVSKTKPTAKAAQPAQPKPAVQAAAIPAGAVEVEPYVYRHTDKDGKVWLYRKTPFGVSRMSEEAQQEVSRANAAAAANLAKVRATDKGETVRFERSTAMGQQSWEKKKSELNAQEKAWLADSVSQVAARPER